MSKMLQMIQQSAVPANIMRFASRGALALPPAEMVEILVFLSTHLLFGERSRMTLSQWDEASAVAICSDPNTPPAVLAYYVDPRNWRMPLLRSLIENPSVTEEQLLTAAEYANIEVAQMMLASTRIKALKAVLDRLAANHAVSHVSNAVHHLDEHGDEDKIIEQIHIEHAEDLKAEANKKFELVKADSDEQDEIAELVEAAHAGAHSEAVPTAAKKEPERLSTIQKITRMSVGERVQLAVKGTKDERFVLIRDGSKVVSLAVLQSPKLSDAEMEMFAAMKNIQQSVLRAIAGNRKFIKQYAVVRALTQNPRCPLEISLKFLPSLQLSDLQGLSKNKNVSDTVRKIALKMYKEKTTTRKS